mgnify:CR=1 FL=1
MVNRPDPLPLVMLAIEVQQLVRDLSEWPQVGALAETLLGAARGHDCLSNVDADRLRTWSRRWKAMPVKLREFYVAEAPDHTVASVALWHVLQGTTHTMSGASRGRLSELYRDTVSEPPPWTLTPRIR